MNQTDLSIRYFRPLSAGRKVPCPSTGKVFDPGEGWRVCTRTGHFAQWSPLSPAAARKVAPALNALAGKLAALPDEAGYAVLSTEARPSAVCVATHAIFAPRRFEIGNVEGHLLSPGAAGRFSPELAAFLNRELGTIPDDGPATETTAERVRREQSGEVAARRVRIETQAQESARVARERGEREGRAMHLLVGVVGEEKAAELAEAIYLLGGVR